MFRLAPVLAVMAIGCRFGFDDAPGADAAFSRAPTYDVDFAQTQLGSLTIARASVGTYVDATGVVRTATADQPRFDHDPITGAPRGLLIEGSRTNLLTSSSELDVDADWFTAGNLVVTPDVRLAPDGTMTADELVDQDTMTITRRASSGAIPDNDLPYTFSVFARAGTATTFSFAGELLLGSVPVQTHMTVDLAAATVLLPPPLATGYGVQPYPDGWVRVWLTLQNTSVGNTDALLSIWSDREAPQTNTGSIYIWGAQVEQAPAMSSYIPTTTDQVTRMADLVTGTDVSWLLSSQGTLRVVASIDPAHTTEQPALCVRGNGTASHCLRRGSTGLHELAAPSRVLFGGEWNASSPRTMMALWDPRELALWDESTGITSAELTSDRTAVQIQYGTDGTRYLDGHLVRVTYWPERVPNAELATLAAD